MALSGPEKAAILLNIIGKKSAENVLRYIPEELAEKALVLMDDYAHPSADAVREVMGDFAQNLNPRSPAAPLPTTAPLPVPIAIPNPRAQEKWEGPLAAFAGLSPREVYMMLMEESALIKAFVLSKLPTLFRDDVIAFMAEEKDALERTIHNLRETPLSKSLEEQIYRTLSQKLRKG